MAVKSRGRGTAAAFGMLLLLAGVAGAGVLWVMSVQRPDRAVDDFARGPVGCTVTLEFSDSGTFYVYEEVVTPENEVFASCEPIPVEGVPFGFKILADGREVAVRDDTSIRYDTDVAVGASVARVEIVTPGRYELVVRGDDPSVVAAVGRAPDEGVSDLQRGALVVGIVGVVLGALMLLLAGRRSSKAADYAIPDGPGWGPEQRPTPSAATWPPEPPRIRQVPVNPMMPPDASASTRSDLVVPDPDDVPSPARDALVATDAVESDSQDLADLGAELAADTPLVPGAALSDSVTSPDSPMIPEPDESASPWEPPPAGASAEPLPPPTDH